MIVEFILNIDVRDTFCVRVVVSIGITGLENGCFGECFSYCSVITLVSTAFVDGDWQVLKEILLSDGVDCSSETVVVSSDIVSSI